MNENLFFERCRIILAQKFKIPPDNINLAPLMECVKRAIKDRCKSKNDELVFEPITEDEKEIIVYNELGPKIIKMIISEEPPFYEWMERYEENYVEGLFRENEGGE